MNYITQADWKPLEKFSVEMKVFLGMLGVLEKYVFVGKRLIFWFSFLCLSFSSLNMKQGKGKKEIKIHRRKNAILVLEKRVKSIKSIKNAS